MAREPRHLDESEPARATRAAARATAAIARRAVDATLASVTGGTSKPVTVALRVIGPFVLGLLAVFALVLVLTVIGVLAGSQASDASTCSPIVATGPGSPPADLLPIYQGAAAQYGLGPDGWAYLAAINRVETDFGQNLSVSSAGAIGWMQFEPGTWAKYGVSVSGTGPPDPYNPNDAIYSAANLLHASGAPANWSQAIYAYNHASWYVSEVEGYASQYAGPGISVGTTGPAGSSGSQASGLGTYGCNDGIVSGTGQDPIPGFRAGRDDMGVDACANPGQPIIAPAASTLVQVIPDWYNRQPLMLFHFNQPLPGTLDNDQYWYVAEQIDPVTIQTPTVFQARQVVARFAPSGTCIEIGWGDPNSTSRTLAGASDPAAAHPAAGALTSWGETFKKYFGIPWVGASP
jgi:hypothetical protein